MKIKLKLIKYENENIIFERQLTHEISSWVQSRGITVKIQLSEESYCALNIDLLCGKQLSLPVVDNETVQKRVENFSTKKASGIDNLSVRFLQMLINYICPSITYLIDYCLRQGVMLKICKSAILTSLFKSGDKKNMNNLRPISILPAIIKVIESVDFEHFIVSKTVWV